MCFEALGIFVPDSYSMVLFHTKQQEKQKLSEKTQISYTYAKIRIESAGTIGITSHITSSRMLFFGSLPPRPGYDLW
jgi:L-lactate utilization protein LutC